MTSTTTSRSDLRLALENQAAEQHRKAMETAERAIVLAMGLGCDTTEDLNRILHGDTRSYRQIKVILESSIYVADQGPAGVHGRHWTLTQEGLAFLGEMHEYQLLERKVSHG